MIDSPILFCLHPSLARLKSPLFNFGRPGRRPAPPSLSRAITVMAETVRGTVPLRHPARPLPSVFARIVACSPGHQPLAQAGYRPHPTRSFRCVNRSPPTHAPRRRQRRTVVMINLAHGQVVRRAPVGVHRVEQLRGKRFDRHGSVLFVRRVRGSGRPFWL